MDQFTPQNIGTLLLVVGAFWVAAQWFVRWCKRVDGRPAYDPLRDGPVDRRQPTIGLTEAAAADIAAIVEQAGIRRELSPSRNMEGAARTTWPKMFHRYATATETEGGHVD